MRDSITKHAEFTGYKLLGRHDDSLVVRDKRTDIIEHLERLPELLETTP